MTNTDVTMASVSKENYCVIRPRTAEMVQMKCTVATTRTSLALVRVGKYNLHNLAKNLILSLEFVEKKNNSVKMSQSKKCAQTLSENILSAKLSI